jgi:hypothetical protein
MANVECLRQLRRVVETAPEDRFEMVMFSGWKDCGTAHRAAGWAAVDPWFRAHTELGRFFHVDEDRDGMLEWDDNPTELLGEVFGLRAGDILRLFGLTLDWRGMVTKQHVLANIDRLLAGRAALPYRLMLTES